MRFFHIIKTGGETLELHLAQHPSPRLDYAHCRRAGRASGWQRNLSALASAPCALSAAGVSAALCALNCECCAEDSIESGLAHGGSFHGTLLRSPRAFLLSLFTHCHTAHTANSWGRVAHDPPQVRAERAPCVTPSPPPPSSLLPPSPPTCLPTSLAYLAYSVPGP